VKKEHSSHFGKCVEDFYPNADLLLAEQKIQQALEKMKHLLLGQETFFFIPELKVIKKFTLICW
jgi:hypothetical protein